MTTGVGGGTHPGPEHPAGRGRIKIEQAPVEQPLIMRDAFGVERGGEWRVPVGVFLDHMHSHRVSPSRAKARTVRSPPLLKRTAASKLARYSVTKPLSRFVRDLVVEFASIDPVKERTPLGGGEPQHRPARIFRIAYCCGVRERGYFDTVTLPTGVSGFLPSHLSRSFISLADCLSSS